MADFDGNASWLKNNDTSNISINIKEHIKNGHHRAKYNFSNDSVSIKLQIIPRYLNYYNNNL